MARRAKKSTVALEDLGNGVKVRRRVHIGHIVPDHFEIAEDEVEVVEAPSTHGYKPHQKTLRPHLVGGTDAPGRSGLRGRRRVKVVTDHPEVDGPEVSGPKVKGPRSATPKAEGKTESTPEGKTE
jgi:hypothetical protein